MRVIFHADANSRKLRIIDFNNFWVAVLKMSMGFHEWINVAEFLHVNLKVTLIINGQIWMCPFRSQDSEICYTSTQK